MSEGERLLSPSEEKNFLDDGVESVKPVLPRRAKPALLFSLIAILLLSLTVNIGQALLYISSERLEAGFRSNLTGLVPDTQAPFGVKSAYGDSSNLTATDLLWESTHTETGMVAVSKRPHLHPTETFPWDTSKGVYMLNGYHGIHCLKLIYKSLRRFQQNEEQEQPFAHVLHCIGALRSDIMCTADDTLRFAGDPDPQDPFHQTRMCRDWSKLEAWAKENSACFRRLDPTDPSYGTLEEWKHCPEGSQYQDAVDEYFAGRSEE